MDVTCVKWYRQPNMFRQTCSQTYRPESAANGPTAGGCSVCIRPEGDPPWTGKYCDDDRKNSFFAFSGTEGDVCDWVPPDNPDLAYEHNLQGYYLLRMPGLHDHLENRENWDTGNLFGRCTDTHYRGDFLLKYARGCRSNYWYSEEEPICGLTTGVNQHMCTTFCECDEESRGEPGLLDPGDSCYGKPYRLTACSGYVGWQPYYPPVDDAKPGGWVKRFSLRLAVEGGIANTYSKIRMYLFVVFYNGVRCGYRVFRTEEYSRVGGDRFNCKQRHAFVEMATCVLAYSEWYTGNGWFCGGPWFPTDPDPQGVRIPEIIPIN